MQVKTIDDIIAYFAAIPPRMIDQKVSMFRPGTPCCFGAHLAGLLEDGKVSYLAGGDALCKRLRQAGFNGCNRAHLTLMLRACGAGRLPFGPSAWPEPPSIVFERLARIEELPSLVNADLSYDKLAHAKMAGADLRGANLSGANLSDANLMFANLEGADLSNACLRETRLKGAVLEGAHLQGANLQEANLVDVEANGAYFECAQASGANFAYADLRGVNFRFADLTKTIMQDADLEGAVLSGTNVKGAVFSGANLWCADLADANILQADLRGTKVYEHPLNIWFRGLWNRLGRKGV